VSTSTRCRRTVAAALLGLLLLPPLTACGADPQEEYCGAVREHQQELTEIVGSGGQDSLLRAQDVFRDLRSKAPSDIADEWQQVVTRLEALDRALRDAGVDPATYDRRTPPDGLSGAEKAAIDGAARELGSRSTLDALSGLDQQARDVCRTPLSL
jgi:hypothetical protein